MGSFSAKDEAELRGLLIAAEKAESDLFEARAALRNRVGELRDRQVDYTQFNKLPDRFSERLYEQLHPR